jgi:MFS transporter, ACS family, tartrate transporter
VIDEAIELATMRRLSFRLLPFLFLLYIFCWLDRGIISIAALQMNSDLNLSPAAFGFGAGIFFLSYSLFEVPSNLLLDRFGARRWLARIAITWGLLTCSMVCVRTPHEFYAVRFLLGMAEAGFFPGVIYYLSLWFPEAYRARAISVIVIGFPLSQVLGAPLGGALLRLTGTWHLLGWQWLFLVEGLPAVLLGLVAHVYLTDRPEDAGWLSKSQRDWVIHRLESERQGKEAERVSPLRVLSHPLLWLLIVPYFAVCAISYGATFWTPLLVRDAVGTSDAATSLIVGGVYLLAAIAHPFAGILSDRLNDRCGLAALGLAIYFVGGVGVALLSHPLLRVASLVVLQLGNPIFMASFWCVPEKLFKGSSAAAAIALVSSVGTSGGFFGPSIIGFLKQTSGGDSSAFLGLAGLALFGALVCIGLRQTAALGANRVIREAPVSRKAA